MSQLMAGIGTADITPKIGMTTGFHIDARIKKIITPLSVSICLIQSDGRKFAIVTADICALFRDSIIDIRNIISKLLDTPSINIYVNASHTHSAPYLHKTAQLFLDDYGLIFLDWEYYDSFLEALKMAANKALTTMTEVTLKYSAGKVEDLGCNRRVQLSDGSIGMRYGRSVPEYLRDYPEGVIDPCVNCLWFMDTHGRPVGGLMNYACHSTAYNQYDEICWDYPGFARNMIEAELGCPVLFMQGCAGNVGTGKYAISNPLEDCVRLGANLAKAVIEGYSAAKTVFPADCIHRNESIGVNVRIHDSVAELQKKLFEEVTEYHRGREKNGDEFLGSTILSLVERLVILQKYPERIIPLEIGVISLGEAVMVFLPSELFIQSAIEIKKHYPGKPILAMAYTDSTVQYIPDIPSFDENGGFETGEDWCFCERGSLEAITGKAIEMISNIE